MTTRKKHRHTHKTKQHNNIQHDTHMRQTYMTEAQQDGTYNKKGNTQNQTNQNNNWNKQPQLMIHTHTDNNITILISEDTTYDTYAYSEGDRHTQAWIHLAGEHNGAETCNATQQQNATHNPHGNTTTQ